MELLTRKLLAQLDRLQLPSHRRMRIPHRGEKSSLRKGSSIEFSDYREYLQGDDIRSIDWSVYARTERLFLKLFLEEESKPVTFVVDASESMNYGTPTKFEYALSLASALSYICLRRYDRPQILILQDQRFTRFPFASQSQFFAMISQLDEVKPSGETHLSAALKKIAYARLARGMYFVLSDFYSYDGFDGLKILAAKGNELHCMQTLTEEETNPTFRGDLKLVDSETTDHAEVSISPQILKRYFSRLAGLQQDLKRTAHRTMSSYYSISTSVPLETLLLRNFCSAGVLV